MTSFINYIIRVLTKEIIGVRAILLRGSQQTNTITDMWSDTDLLIVLDQGLSLNEQEVKEAIGQIGDVAGSEMYRYNDHSFLYRAAIEYQSTIELLDVQVCTCDEWSVSESRKVHSSTIVYGDITLGISDPCAPGQYSFESYDYNSTWFKYYITIKKFFRNDNLIGLHLLMDLIREYLVVEMIERDIMHRTNIHRYGYGERLPSMIKMSLIDTSNMDNIFEFIKGLAYEYDLKLVRNLNGYQSRYKQVAEYLDQSARFQSKQ